MRHRTVLSIVLAAVTVAAGALVVSRRSSAPPDPAVVSEAVVAAPVASPPVSPVDVVGARRAAVMAVGRTGEVVAAGMFHRRDLVAEFATAGFAPRLAATTGEQINGFLLEAGFRGADTPAFAVTEVPVTASAVVTEFGVRVLVWSVVVVVVPSSSVAREVWRTVTVDVVDVDGRWWVDGWSSVPGPAPSPLPDAAFGDVATVRDRLAWDPAGRGVG
jgi:hypothetical protein